MSFKHHHDADLRIASARRLVHILLESTDLYPAHRREFLKLALWKVTEAESGKHNTRFRSRASCEPGAITQHEHVFERAKMVNALIAEPHRFREILDDAVACTVTKDEHARLTALSRTEPELEGWARYAAANIEIVDMATWRSSC